MVRDASDEDGRLPISDIGNMLARRYPDFDSRNYGFKKLTQFVRSLNLFDVIFEPAENGHGKVGYVAEKEIHRYRPRIHV
jgi:Fe-S-cluster formation regulator IscX/YfhJ